MRRTKSEWILSESNYEYSSLKSDPKNGKLNLTFEWEDWAFHLHKNDIIDKIKAFVASLDSI